MAKTPRFKGQTLSVTTTQLDAQLPIVHNWGVVPDLTFKVYNGSAWEIYDPGNYFYCTTTTISNNGTTLVSNIGAGVPVILTYFTLGL